MCFMPLAVAVCVSGRGSNLAALLDALNDLGGSAPARVGLVLSNRAEAGALHMARARQIPAIVFENPARAEEWTAPLREHRIDLLVLAGYLKLVPSEVVAAYRNRILNVHPALLPAFGGPGMYGLAVHRAVLAAGVPESGATVHLVTEEYDQGPILAQARVPVEAGDTPESLAARVLGAEHRLLPAAVIAAARAGQPVPFTFSEE